MSLTINDMQIILKRIINGNLRDCIYNYYYFFLLVPFSRNTIFVFVDKEGSHPHEFPKLRFFYKIDWPL